MVRSKVLRRSIANPALPSVSDSYLAQVPDNHGYLGTGKTEWDKELLNTYAIMPNMIGHVQDPSMDAHLQTAIQVTGPPMLQAQDFFNRHAFKRDNTYLPRYLDMVNGFTEPKAYDLLPCGNYF